MENVKYEDIYEVKRRQTASASVFFFYCMVYLYNDKNYVVFGRNFIYLSIFYMGFMLVITIMKKIKR